MPVEASWLLKKVFVQKYVLTSKKFFAALNYDTKGIISWKVLTTEWGQSY